MGSQDQKRNLKLDDYPKDALIGPPQCANWNKQRNTAAKYSTTMKEHVKLQVIHRQERLKPKNWSNRRLTTQFTSRRLLNMEKGLRSRTLTANLRRMRNQTR